MPVVSDFKSIHEKNWEIYFSQCYPNGALKLPELSNILQLTASEHADKGGVGFIDLQANDQSWVMNRMRIEISALPKWSDVATVKTWIEELKGVKSQRNFEISVDGKKLIGVSTLWAIFNMKTRRPEAMHVDTSHVERYPDIHATEIPNRKIPFNFDAVASYTSEVQFSDLDIVNHVNNIKYLEWCLNHIDPTLILENKIKAIDLNFLKELSLGDSFQIEKGEQDNVISFRIMKEGQMCFVCAIELS